MQAEPALAPVQTGGGISYMRSSLLIRVHLRSHFLLPSRRGTGAVAHWRSLAILGRNAPEQAAGHSTETSTTAATASRCSPPMIEPPLLVAATAALCRPDCLATSRHRRRVSSHRLPLSLEQGAQLFHEHEIMYRNAIKLGRSAGRLQRRARIQTGRSAYFKCFRQVATASSSFGIFFLSNGILKSAS